MMDFSGMGSSKVFAIVVTYNPKQWLRKCLGSLVGSSIHVNIIVVDNGSSDGSITVVKKNYPEAHLLETGNNLGFGRANNLGMKMALEGEADYIFLLNQDAWVESETIEKLVGVHKSNREYGIISPIHLNGKGNMLDKRFMTYITSPDDGGRRLISDLVRKKRTEDIYELEYVNAAAWLLSSECVKRVGGFDPIFRHYGEDDNYVSRVKYHKYKVGLCPDVFIFHDREDLISHNDSAEYFSHLEVLERSFKREAADINKQYDSYAPLGICQRNIFKSIIFGRFKRAFRQVQEYRTMRKAIPEIIRSRKINSTLGQHYL